MQIYSAKKTVMKEHGTLNAVWNIQHGEQRIYTSSLYWHVYNKVRIYYKVINDKMRFVEERSQNLGDKLTFYQSGSNQEPETILVILTEGVKELLTAYYRIKEGKREHKDYRQIYMYIYRKKKLPTPGAGA